MVAARGHGHGRRRGDQRHWRNERRRRDEWRRGAGRRRRGADGRRRWRGRSAGRGGAGGGVGTGWRRGRPEAGERRRGWSAAGPAAPARGADAAGLKFHSGMGSSGFRPRGRPNRYYWVEYGTPYITVHFSTGNIHRRTNKHPLQIDALDRHTYNDRRERSARRGDVEPPGQGRGLRSGRQLHAGWHHTDAQPIRAPSTATGRRCTTRNDPMGGNPTHGGSTTWEPPRSRADVVRVIRRPRR